jgi:UDP-N-acetyl-D-glucosamine dehydrogenase
VGSQPGNIAGDRRSSGRPGYVGLPLAMRAVTVGHDVIGYDTDAVRVKRLEVGESYVEDMTSSDLARR